MSDFYFTVKDVPMTPIRKGKDKGKSCLPAHSWKKHKGKKQLHIYRTRNTCLELLGMSLSVEALIVSPTTKTKFVWQK